MLDEQTLIEILQAAKNAEAEKKLIRALEALLACEADPAADITVPNSLAFEGILYKHLRSRAIDGWIYSIGADDQVYANLVSAIRSDESRSRDEKDPLNCHMILGFYGPCPDNTDRYQLSSKRLTFVPADVSRRKISSILADKGLLVETEEHKESYLAQMAHLRKVNQFAHQLRANGKMLRVAGERFTRYGEAIDITGHRLINDTEASELFEVDMNSDCAILPSGEVARVPVHPILRCFDLKSHDMVLVHAGHLEHYQYDGSLRDKLILPPTHRDLLDVLTTDISAFTEDMIEGKSAGNVILCKGVPGVGKTLTAEVYAELIEKPLYSIHSGTLGTTASQIQENLTVVFERINRWECVALLDEADVFVAKRGDSIEQNAIVAEFLRTMEYFSGLLFMTSNRPNDIDDAILNRCIAVLDYEPPREDEARKVWKVMNEMFGAGMNDEMIEDLVKLFPGLPPRDCKMLTRLVMKFVESPGNKSTMSVDLFRRCAMFRAIKMRPIERQ